MPSYAYVAVDPRGLEQRGSLEVNDQQEALRRIKQMGLFPTRLLAERTPARETRPGATRTRIGRRGRGGRVNPAALAVFTRQLATLLQAGMPLLRGLRTLEEQTENRRLKRIIGSLSVVIEGGGTLTEALAAHPKIFNKLYVNMAKAGEIGGALDVTLRRLSEYLEKAERVKGKVKAALYYPCSVLVVAAGIMCLLMIYVVPRFQQIFDGLANGIRMPAFTMFIFNLSNLMREHALAGLLSILGLCAGLWAGSRTTAGRWIYDRLKLSVPMIGPVFRKSAIARFSRTLGTLVTSGVPILQALTIVKETAGNRVVAGVIARLHENVKQGDPLAPTLKATSIFPAMVAGMVDVGEQTGALPEMLMTVADTYEEEVDNSVSAMTSLLEPVMILILAFIVGGIVVALFLPLVTIILHGDGGTQAGGPD
jgi:type IV pilus assembly protein PilC